MRIRLVPLLWLALAVGVAVWGWRTWASEERRLLRRLDALAENLSRQPGESDLEAAARSRALGTFFADPFSVEVAPIAAEVSDRDRLAQLAFGYRRSRERIGVDFRDVDLALDERLASAVLAARVVVTASGDGLDREAYRVEIHWRKVAGEWSIERLRVLEVLEGRGFL